MPEPTNTELVKHWRDRHGDVCPGYGRKPHDVKAKDLSVWEKPLGGTPAVLCKECKKRAS